jgi:iron complex outermembrane receptor protein
MFNLRHTQTLLILASLGIAFSSQANAMELAMMDEMDPLLWGEEETIYTATKFNKRLDQAPAIATVITAEEILNSGARDITDVLNLVPGFAVSTHAASGWKGMEIRGIRSEHTEKVLFMVDGQSLYFRTNGSFLEFHQLMSVKNIARVEVIRSPGSALYGTNAMVAVINIVTKKAEEIRGVETSVAAGSFQRREINLLFGESEGANKFSGFVHALDTNGPDTFISQDAIGNSGDIGAEARRFDLGLSYQHQQWTADFRYISNATGSHYGTIGALNDESDIHDITYFGVLKYRESITDSIEFSGKVYYDLRESDREFELLPENAPLTVPDGSGGTITLTLPDGLIGQPRGKIESTGVELQYDFTQFEKQTITLGLFAEHVSLFNPTDTNNFGNPFAPLVVNSAPNAWSEPASRKTFALYAQDVISISNNLEATVGARYDNYSDFGDTLNPRAALVWTPHNKVTTRLLYGQAFRAPQMRFISPIIPL